MMRYGMLATASNTPTLAGTAMGRQMLARLIEQTKPVAEPTIAYLDFIGVDIATGSFLREAVMGFRDFCRNAAGLLYPVVANANPLIAEELSTYLKGRNDAIWGCTIDANNKVVKSHILGELESSQLNTLNFVGKHHPVSAPDLAKLWPNEGIGTTAWNNRLATLAAKGILMETRNGKAKLFSPVMEIYSGQ